MVTGSGKRVERLAPRRRSLLHATSGRFIDVAGAISARTRLRSSSIPASRSAAHSPRSREATPPRSGRAWRGAAAQATAGAGCGLSGDAARRSARRASSAGLGPQDKRSARAADRHVRSPASRLVADAPARPPAPTPRSGHGSSRLRTPSAVQTCFEPGVIAGALEQRERLYAHGVSSSSIVTSGSNHKRRMSRRRRARAPRPARRRRARRSAAELGKGCGSFLGSSMRHVREVELELRRRAGTAASARAHARGGQRRPRSSPRHERAPPGGGEALRGPLGELRDRAARARPA